jgi:hypothetical protein
VFPVRYGLSSLSLSLSLSLTHTHTHTHTHIYIYIYNLESINSFWGKFPQRKLVGLPFFWRHSLLSVTCELNVYVIVNKLQPIVLVRNVTALCSDLPWSCMFRHKSLICSHSGMDLAAASIHYSYFFGN